jgi:rsbT co-antagonist protein RsbR
VDTNFAALQDSSTGKELLHEITGAVSAGDLTRLRMHERLLRSMADNMAICVWEVDRTGLFTYHYGKGLTSAGLRQGQYVGQNVFELYGEEHVQDVRRALGGEASHSFSASHGVDWENWLVPIRDVGGEVIALNGFTLDISATKRAERELNTRIDTIQKQQRIIRDLTTPILQVWEKVLALPMMGVVDSMRTAEVMEILLNRIVETQARFAILDLTGVEVVDTRVASHLLNLVSAIALLGAEGIVTGIRPTVAQTMVGLGVDLSRVVTRGNLQAGLSYCIGRMNDLDRTGHVLPWRPGGAPAPG